MHYTANNLLIKSHPPSADGVFTQVLAEKAGWEYLNMTARRLARAATWEHTTDSYEYVHVILGGHCHIHTSQGDFLNIGRRPNVFSGMPYAVYLSRKTDFVIEALSDDLEIATCWVPVERDYPARLITPADSTIEIRGGANATRQINSIIPPGFNCQRLVCVEVYTPSGNWSSYPPHKHDVHREDEDGNILEADLEEIYFYKLDRPGGYAYQRVYNDDRSIDALMMAEHHDAVLVPEGYHPVVSAHGYTTYYLNFLAGSAQSLANVDDPHYSWVKQTWTFKDPRLPIVDHGMEPYQKQLI
jgi:5-deoxy-glucuronate isomerase